MKKFSSIKNIIETKYFEYLAPKKVGFISTMSRSGTWYNREFFFFFNELLSNKSKDQIIDEFVLEKKKIKYLIKVKKEYFNFDSFIISHWQCPGFESNYRGFMKKKWENLKFYNENIPSKLRPRTKVFNVNSQCNPYKNKNAKVIFYYRNPLDQCVALYNAIQKTTNDMNFYFEGSKKKKFQSIEEFITIAGIDMYLKHFLGFKLMNDLFPENILLLKYEDMIQDPEKNFVTVLNFFNLDNLITDHNKKFYQALEMSSPDQIKKIEKLSGISISHGFINKSESQIQSGKINNWKNFLTKDIIKLFEKRFSDFNLDLKNI
mgnify:CR=1 FL=1